MTIDEIYTKYKHLFGQTIGVDCPNGWLYLLETLFETVDRHVKARNMSFQCYQVKEKFGGLRIYADCDAELSGMIILAEAISYSICQVCSAPKATQTNSGWIRTLCSSCINGNKQD